MYCIAAMIIAIGGISYILKRIRTKDLILKYPLVISYDTGNILPVIIALASTTALWLWGNKMALPAYDEVFSAQNAAGINPFQCISYYMQPNNHLFFNFVNNILFHPSIDKVITGRVISLFAYSGFIVVIFFLFKQLIKNRWLALLVSITLANQFFIWGFSFQARGYELYLLTEWGSFISLFSYLVSAQKRWLYVNLLCIAFGYFCLPSMLYIHAAQLLFVCLHQLVYKKKEILFWKYQVAAGLLSFLFYLPTLSFSGMESITHNNYVAPMGFKTVSAFLAWVLPYFRTYIGHIFSNIQWHGINFSITLVFLPFILLLARKNKPYFLFGLFYLCMWVTFFLIASAMKRVPFERNLIGHYSITFAGVILVVYWLSGIVSKGAVSVAFKWVLFPAFLTLFIIHFIRTDKIFLKDTLYEYNVNEGYNFKKNWLSIIPSGCTVACSDEEFYATYICRKNGCIVSRCPTGNENYFVKYVSEQLPPAYVDRYELINDTWGYQIYRRK